MRTYNRYGHAHYAVNEDLKGNPILAAQWKSNKKEEIKDNKANDEDEEDDADDVKEDDTVMEDTHQIQLFTEEDIAKPEQLFFKCEVHRKGGNMFFHANMDYSGNKKVYAPDHMIAFIENDRIIEDAKDEHCFSE